MIHRIIYPLFITAAALVTVTYASAQVRRTVALNTSRGTTTVYLSEEVDVHPSFPGGDRQMLEFINSERHYPAEAYRAGIEGRVLCSVLIDADGSIAGVEVVRGVERSLDAEAVRIIEAMPKWKPGLIDNTPVPTLCLIPVSFRL